MVTAPVIVLLADRIFEFASLRGRSAPDGLYAGLAATRIVPQARSSRRDCWRHGVGGALDVLLNQAALVRYLRFAEPVSRPRLRPSTDARPR
jgi:hypothetical protein